jgi:lipopolysaccharide/colanic/teichoic acid biosynthesis glycosyltransferase
MIIGPTLIGRNATVGRYAVVAQCYLVDGACVGAGEVNRHQVVTRQHAATTAHPEPRPQRRHSSQSPPVAPPRVSSWWRPPYAELKSWVEVPLAMVLLLVLLPLLALLALLVRLTSRGPVFYFALREGKDANVFKCCKFRSMHVDADARQRELLGAQIADGPQFKMERDPRLTPIGHFLRSSNLDELPQLFNVAMRQMSFVGPRPSPFHENQICVPWREGRLSMRPGITGLWQVCRRDRAEGDFHQWIYYDLLYVEHASFLLDVRILAATILTGGGRRPVKVTTIIPGISLPQAPVEQPDVESPHTYGVDGAPREARRQANGGRWRRSSGKHSR